MKIKFAFTSAALIAATLALASDRKYPKAKVSFEDFKTIVTAVEGGVPKAVEIVVAFG